MGNALRLHPLVVIFGLAVGFEVYGFAGALTALPFLAAGRAIWEFFHGRFELQPWGPRTPPPWASSWPTLTWSIAWSRETQPRTRPR